MARERKGRIAQMTDQECRAYYRRIRERSEANKATFDARVKEAFERGVFLWAAGGNPPNPLTIPQQWVECAREVRFKCGRCGGTGQFITMMVNGKLTGPGGECFRCKGRGTQSDHDVRRNEEHDKHYMGRCAG